MKLNIKTALFFLLVLFTSKGLFAQDFQVTDFKVTASNLRPAVNELVELTVEFELGKTFSICNLEFDLPDPAETKNVTGDTLFWSGSVTKGERYKKIFSFRFLKEREYHFTVLLIGVAESVGQCYGCRRTKELNFYPGKSFDENDKVRLLRAAVENAEMSLASLPDYSNDSRYTVKVKNSDDSLKQTKVFMRNHYVNLNPPDRLKNQIAKMKYVKFNAETERKNDSLAVSLLEQYKSIYDKIDARGFLPPPPHRKGKPVQYIE